MTVGQKNVCNKPTFSINLDTLERMHHHKVCQLENIDAYSNHGVLKIYVFPNLCSMSCFSLILHSSTWEIMQ